MEFKTIIKKDGTTVVEVLDRKEHLCADVYKITARLGTQLSDEELPDCPQPVHNTTGT